MFPLRYRLSFRCLRFWFLIILIQNQQFPCDSFLFLRVSFSNDTFQIINFSIFQFFFTYLHKSFFEIISCLVPKGFVSYHHRGSGYNYLFCSSYCSVCLTDGHSFSDQRRFHRKWHHIPVTVILVLEYSYPDWQC